MEAVAFCSGFFFYRKFYTSYSEKVKNFHQILIRRSKCYEKRAEKGKKDNRTDY